MKKIERRHHLHHILRRDISPFRYGISSILSGKFSSLLNHVSEVHRCFFCLLLLFSPKVIFSIFFFVIIRSHHVAGWECFCIIFILNKRKKYREKSSSSFHTQCFFFCISMKAKTIMWYDLFIYTLLVSLSLSHFNFLS